MLPVKTFPWKEFLREHPMFSTVRADRRLEALLEDSASTERILGRAEVVLRQGATGDSVFVVGSGSTEAFLEAGDGSELSLSVMRAGDVFGEMAFLERQPRSATVRAIEPSVVLEIHGTQFRDLMDDHPDIEFRLLLKMSGRLRQLNETLQEFRATLERRVEDRTDELAAINEKLEASNARLQELDRLKSDFVSDVSHELRAPLTSISGYVDHLLDGMAGELSPAQKECLARVRGSTERMIRLINDLLDLARIEAGRVDLHLARLSLGEVAGEVLDVLQPFASDKGIGLDVEIPPVDILVRADRDKLHQILLNLVHNAVKFTPPGGKVRVGVSVRGDGTVVTTVRDTGEGIAVEDLPRVFEKFSQVGDPETQKKGSGLGLTITQKLVALHGGTIWVESLPGTGTEFAFSLPAAEPEP
jgi:signal transduction histidine kinase